MGAMFRSSTTATCKAVTAVLAIAAVATLLTSTGGYDAQEETPAVPCEYLGLGATLLQCIDWCNKQGHYGGGFLRRVCCCGPRLPPPQQAAAALNKLQ